MTGTAMSPLMTAKDLAHVLNVSLRTVWRLKRAGRLPASLHVGGGVRWKPDEVQNWIETTKTQTSVEAAS